MKRFALCLILILPLAGCPSATSTTPPPAVAPGYSSQPDQVLGQSLASLNSFTNSEKSNYQCDSAAQTAQTCLTAAQQAAEKSYLNGLIQAVDLANQAYMAFHSGTQTLAQAQTAYSNAQTQQAALQTAKGVK